jgi:hypothetical protein
LAKLPPPPQPAVLAARSPADVVVVTRVTTLWRIYTTTGPHGARWDRMRHYGPLATARFDHHLPPAAEQARGVLYAGLAIQTCVAEFFQDTRVIDCWRRGAWLVGFRLAREARLLDLSGTWPTRAGASQAISSGPRLLARAWAVATYEAFSDLDGLWYRSSMDGGRPAIVLNERIETGLRAQPDVNLPLSHPGLALPLVRMGRTLGYLLA